RPLAYWSVPDTVSAGLANPLDGTPQDAVNLLEHELSRAVQGQMLSDVPLGAFLSGGIDSSAVVALMQAHSPRPVRTFTIGFDDNRYDEAPHAAAIAKHLGNEHIELHVVPDEVMAVVR